MNAKSSILCKIGSSWAPIGTLYWVLDSVGFWRSLFLDSHSSYTDLGHVITCGWDRVMGTRNAVPMGVRSDSAAIDHAISDKERNRRIRRRSGLSRH
jgi:hypothetical protein